MSLYKVSCPSECGSYFVAYLQSVSVIAANKDDALTQVKQWLKTSGKSFIYPQEKWTVLEVAKVMQGIVDWNEDSDY